MVTQRASRLQPDRYPWIPCSPVANSRVSKKSADYPWKSADTRGSWGGYPLKSADYPLKSARLSMPNFTRSKPDGLLTGTRGKSTSSTGDSKASTGDSPTATSSMIPYVFSDRKYTKYQAPVVWFHTCFRIENRPNIKRDICLYFILIGRNPPSHP